MSSQSLNFACETEESDTLSFLKIGNEMTIATFRSSAQEPVHYLVPVGSWEVLSYNLHIWNLRCCQYSTNFRWCGTFSLNEHSIVYSQ